MNVIGKVLTQFGFLLLFISCMKEPKTEITYGPPIQRKKIALELQKAIGEDDSPGDFRKEDAVLKENTRQIRGRAAIDVLSRTNFTIVDRIEIENQWQISVTENFQQFDPGNPTHLIDPIIREDPRCFNKETFIRENCETPSLRLNQKNTQEKEAYLVPLNVFQQSTLEDDEILSYHNLIVKNYRIAPPIYLERDPQCGGIPDCLINVTEVGFDRVNWTNDPNGYKIHFSLKISKDVPQLARYLETCQQGSVQIISEGQDPKTAPRFLVTFCETVRDFKQGPKPTVTSVSINK